MHFFGAFYFGNKVNSKNNPYKTLNNFYQSQLSNYVEICDHSLDT